MPKPHQTTAKADFTGQSQDAPQEHQEVVPDVEHKDRKQVWHGVQERLRREEDEMREDITLRELSFDQTYPNDRDQWWGLHERYWLVNRYTVCCIGCGRHWPYSEAVTMRKGRGSLLTCGDVEENPGPDQIIVQPRRSRRGRSRNNNNRSQVVIVEPSVNNLPRGSGRRRRNAARRRRRTIRQRVINAGHAKQGPIMEDDGLVTGPDGWLNPLMGRLSLGRTTQDRVLHQVSMGTLDPSEGALGWYYKYMDPAGAVESGKALGEFSKIPDGLLRFSVDAEQRPVITEECPEVEGSLPLDGELWSITFISVPAFRLNYIAVASVNNEEMTQPVVNGLVRTLNNLVNWRTHAEGPWEEFAAGWYYRIRVLPNTFQMADERGYSDGITAFRKSYRGVTFEFNAPTLLDQGWWVGGHMPIKPRSISVPQNGETTMTSLTLTVTGRWSNSTPATVEVDIPGLPNTIEATTIGDITVNTLAGSEFSRLLELPNSTTDIVGAGLSFVTTEDLILNDAQWASVGDTITLTITSAGSVTTSWTLTSSATGTAAIVLTLNNIVGSTTTQPLEVIVESTGYNRLSVELPPLTTSELTTNNPKIEQFLCKESGGAYLVHYKMNNPVFEMTGEENFGNIKFHYPGYPPVLNADGNRGIVDTWENNFSTAVVLFRGISKSATIVTKTYDGWEGTTSTAGELGQFAHTGAEEECEIMDLAGRLQTELTGVYQADDNFAALVSALASQAISSLARGVVTNSTIKKAAETAVGVVTNNPEIATDALGLVGTIGSRLAGAIKRRRERRRTRNNVRR